MSKHLAFVIDRPLAFRYEGKTGALAIEAYSPTLGAFAVPGADPLSALRVEITPEAVQALMLLVKAIETNPDRDIEGSSSEPNVQ